MYVIHRDYLSAVASEKKIDWRGSFENGMKWRTKIREIAVETLTDVIS